MPSGRCYTGIELELELELGRESTEWETGEARVKYKVVLELTLYMRYELPRVLQ